MSGYSRRYPTGPAHIEDLLTAEGFCPKGDTARRALIEYRVLQLRWQELEKDMPHVGRGRPAEPSILPPCFSCKPVVFYYCECTGRECWVFKKYCNTNRIYEESR